VTLQVTDSHGLASEWGDGGACKTHMMLGGIAYAEHVSGPGTKQ
jgi:hypothetical protein